MNTLTLQMFFQHQWQDVAELYFDEKTHELINFSYLTEFVVTHFGECGAKAISINYPVMPFNDHEITQFHAVLNDIVPGGASRRYWIDALGIKQDSEATQTYKLLKQATIAPIGNLRIKEAVPVREELLRHFHFEDAVNRQIDFLEYANQRGAMVGGATGAGGEAPKLLLRRAADQIWIDNQQAGNETGEYYLVKYPRGKRSTIDCDILRAEYHYYHELTKLGFSTIDTHKMLLVEGEHYPSLWLPRFDIIQDAQGNVEKRYAVESIYSVLKKVGGELNHTETLTALIATIKQSGLEFQAIDQLVVEWVKRDFLNIVFGNSDNHGRNMAFLRDDNKIRLAPIYDFAPMRADPEVIIRTTRWSSSGNSPQELGGEYDFQQIAESLRHWVQPDDLLAELSTLASQVIDLGSRLAERGVPESILHHPAIGFQYLPQKLKKWGLI